MRIMPIAMRNQSKESDGNTIDKVIENASGAEKHENRRHRGLFTILVGANILDVFLIGGYNTTVILPARDEPFMSQAYSVAYDKPKFPFFIHPPRGDVAGAFIDRA
jgi:hypothetical protein